ncbi:ferrochelatase [Phenylobacterium zucineum HLK1]|uniref:Ferrochelatase n=1 Tax=Phenylobacterium zucineum (strain HLK1) TaxID=450851 RepID=HEMH_PHEZH|nr:ferrochelatase [Phenylobacterium zucineum]B4RD10.1 RecName: Full=Ferrochelatase; AltName: Full=Heme synthase; AltName: Full=Protoheme ferro-lyase [Phenylobacterium zucineum HLK1]ACG79942.1 ferrochelatase [Phenylobacterium zucineum HLK1]
MKLAVVLFNLGGPDGPEAVRPFLFNLFRDPAIIGLPAIARYPLAALISTTREKTAQANYAIMGGRSPLLPETEAQARALEAELARRAPDVEARAFIAMRYWRPLAKETARQVAAFAPDEIVLLPLYPQYSTTTTGSSVKDWARAYKGPGKSRTVCCYPNAPGLAEAHARLIRQTWEKAGKPSDIRLLFSAHGLPQKVVDAGDPYEAQVQASAAAVAALLPEFTDWGISYQSRVGPLKWLGPATDDEVRRAGAEGKGLLVSPIAFVSEHVETLVELDHEYAALAKESGVPVYLRAPAPGVAEPFIGTLAEAALGALDRSGAAPFGPWLCPAAHGRCACRNGGTA